MDVTRNVQVLIMAGGQGERLYPLTASRPKPAVSFGGLFRIIDFTLSNCLNSGLGRVCLLTQYKHEELQSYIRQSWSGLWTAMTREPLTCIPPSGGNRYLGTADAVFQNIASLRQCEAEFVLVLSADQVYHMDYRKLLRSHAETDADLTVACVEHPVSTAKQFGVVEADSTQRVVGFQEKPGNPRTIPGRPNAALISMGAYAFKKEVLIRALIENCNEKSGYDFGRHVIPSLVGSAHIRAYDFRHATGDTSCYWRDIGTLDTYYETNMELVRPDAPFDPYASDDWPSCPERYRSSGHVRILDGSPPTGSHSQGWMTRLRTDCRITRSVLSPGVRVEDGSSIESSVLMPHVWVGRGAQIRRAIIEEGVHIPAGFHVGFNPESDRKHYFVTGTGVVVVTQTPQHSRQAGVCPPRRIAHETAESSSAA